MEWVKGKHKSEKQNSIMEDSESFPAMIQLFGNLFLWKVLYKFYNNFPKVKYHFDLM